MMSKCLVSTLLCLLCALWSAVGDDVPTIAISCGNTPLTDLPKYYHSMDALGFKKVLSSLWNEDTKVVMVLENELSLEDFTAKDTDGHSLFQLFENTKDRRFFPSVDQPLKAIEMLSKNGFSINAFNDETYVNGSGKILALADLDENNHNINDDSRQSTLQSHNNYVTNMFNNLCKKYSNVVLVLSGKLNPWIERSEASHHLVTRHLMAADGTKSEKFILDTGKALIFSSSYPFLTIDNGPATQLEDSKSEIYVDNSRTSLLKITKTYLVNDTTKVTLRFRFEKTDNTWDLKGTEYESENSMLMLRPNVSISTNIGTSFYVNGPVVFSNDSVVLTFMDNLQVEPWIPVKRRSTQFSESQETEAFFSPPILAGLFVTALMLFIVAWGIIMIMDIKTMDRFDDPKGKTISINVVE